MNSKTSPGRPRAGSPYAAGGCSQLDLFERDPCEHLFPYWRESLRGWLEDVWQFRHKPETTGWSMACQGFIFAEFLYQHGQMIKPDFRRYWRFNRRVKRWHDRARWHAQGRLDFGTANNALCVKGRQ